MSREGNFLSRLPKARINFHRGLIITARRTVFSAENSLHFIKNTMATTNKTKGGREKERQNATQRKLKRKPNFQKPSYPTVLVEREETWFQCCTNKAPHTAAAVKCTFGDALVQVFFQLQVASWVGLAVQEEQKQATHPTSPLSPAQFLTVMEQDSCNSSKAKLKSICLPLLPALSFTSTFHEKQKPCYTFCFMHTKAILRHHRNVQNGSASSSETEIFKVTSKSTCSHICVYAARLVLTPATSWQTTNQSHQAQSPQEPSKIIYLGAISGPL